MSQESWSVVCTEKHQRIDVATHAACLTLDPRLCSIVLDCCPPTAMSHEISSGAVVRLFFEGESVDWSATLEWLTSEMAQQLLCSVSAGYAAEMLWSGDWRVEWSQAAGQAVDSIRVQVTELTRAQPP